MVIVRFLFRQSAVCCRTSCLCLLVLHRSLQQISRQTGHRIRHRLLCPTVSHYHFNNKVLFRKNILVSSTLLVFKFQREKPLPRW